MPEPKRKRLTNAEKVERAEFAARERRLKERMKNQSERASALRSKDREFHGLEREFLQLQDQMIFDYHRSKDIKHPRDVGTAREEILRRFLLDSGLLPKRYAVSSKSVRVASTTGHLSNELDLLLYDPVDSISLMRRQGVYDVFPVESTYGAIQVKSKVTRKDIKEGLGNIATFKALKRLARREWSISSGGAVSSDGFGLLFAFDTDLDWMDIVDEVEHFAKSNPKQLWSNAVFVLSKGFVIHGDERSGKLLNEDLQMIDALQIHGRPDRDGLCLYNFYSVLLELLGNTEVQRPPISNYFRLPLVAGEYSYEFSFGHFVEYGVCDRHGDFSRKLTADKLVEVIKWCIGTEPINWVRATELAYGLPGDNVAAYIRQPGDVRIYNPEALPLSEILVMDRAIERDGSEITIKVNAFDGIRTAGMEIWIPYYYEIKEKLINLCPKCEKEGRFDD